MTYVIAQENVNLLTKGAGLYASGSRAKVESLCAIAIATFRERTLALMTPANVRPKTPTIEAGIRKAMGGASKLVDRGRYDACSLGFRVMYKLQMEHEAEFVGLVQAAQVAKLATFLTLLAGDGTESAVRAWVIDGTRYGRKTKSPFEKVSALLANAEHDLTDDQINKLQMQLAKIVQRRISIAVAVWKANASKASSPRTESLE